MDVAKIFALLPDSLLEELAIETQVNRYSKKLQGQVIFKLLIYCILTNKDNSLRGMESAYESLTFSLLNAANSDKKGIRFSSISERLSIMNAAFFEKLYAACVSIYGKEIGEESSSIVRFDSTIVALSSQLLKVGYHLKGGDASHVRQLKFTIGLSELPTAAQLFTEQKYTSENVALKEVISTHLPEKNDAIRIFDRGITSRKTHDELCRKHTPFISRITPKSKHEIYLKNTLKQNIETTTLNIYADEWVYLYASGKDKSQYPLRCVRALSKSNKDELAFVTNIPDLSAAEITELYKRRWDIEVFFKFLKQELNFSHLINRSENGIRIMLYATLIAAILLLVYKKKNNLNGYKIMKLRFVQELEKAVVKDIVILCNGDPHLFEKYFENSPP
jgi:hypothetical protein